MYKRKPLQKKSIDKFTFVFSGLVAVLGFALYPIIIRPILYTDEYRNVQKETRKGINQEEIQPGNMRVWSDPFKPREDSKK